MTRYPKTNVAILTISMMLMFQSTAHALSGTYVVLTKGGGGLAMFFNEKGTFTSIARAGRNKQKHYSKGKYTVSGNTLTIKTADGVTGDLSIEANGDIYDSRTNIRLHRYNRRK